MEIEEKKTKSGQDFWPNILDICTLVEIGTYLHLPKTCLFRALLITFNTKSDKGVKFDP
jgi:hypothetical protein